jgi:hypothetical protein
MGGGTAGGSGGGMAGGSGGSGGAPGVDCGGTTCSGATPVCCADSSTGSFTMTCKASCPADPDGGVAASFACDGPEDCTSAGASVCCADVQLAAGTHPTCPATRLASQCAAGCPLTVGTTCPTEGFIRMCRSTAADCPGGKCCEVQQGGATLGFCVPMSVSCTERP